MSSHALPASRPQPSLPLAPALPYPSRTMSKPANFQSPKGLRDYYPAEMLRRRFIEKAWRDTSLRHGFDEIEGPLFEYTDLYTVKSGEGILGEIFGVFSGKDEQQVQGAGQGRAPFALRPEFTPTLARMYATRAAQLPKPTKWFMGGPFFRAERPQRGRLREFLQWNIDFLGAGAGDNIARADAETIACCIDLFAGLGLTPSDLKVSLNDRRLVTDLLTHLGIPGDRQDAAMTILDRADRMSEAEVSAQSTARGLDADFIARYRDLAARALDLSGSQGPAELEQLPGLQAFRSLFAALNDMGLGEWLRPDPAIVRGLAYYTGMVFEVHEVAAGDRALAGGGRAVAGGGRYDNLIELFGGPATPAVGFGMGDVVLSLILEDRGLMPQGSALAERFESPPTSPRPDIFIISNGTPEADAQLPRVIAALRRQGFHARQSYKATKNIGKLLKEANDLYARYAAILESGTEATLKPLSAPQSAEPGSPSANQQRMHIDEIFMHIQRQMRQG